MKQKFDDTLEQFRVRIGDYASKTGDRFGAFRIQHNGVTLTVLASAGEREFPWEHVSVSLPDRTPTWEEMCWIKDIFWEPSEAVVQFHPPHADYVDFHPHCLHMWRPRRFVDRIRLPPIKMV